MSEQLVTNDRERPWLYLQDWSTRREVLCHASKPLSQSATS